ncbi:MAG: hypothetical protein AAF494_11810 [Pseudomonadota bacterium]
MPDDASRLIARRRLSLIAGIIGAAQVGLIVLVLAMLIFAPRSDQPALAYPLDRKGRSAMIALLSAPDAQLLANGPLDGSLIINGPRPGFAEMLLSRRVLMLNARAPGCGPSRASGDRQSS